MSYRPPPRLLVVTGPPGAGRSTVARLLADRFDPSVGPATRKMHTEFERADVDDRHLLTDPPPGDPIATADRVLAARADGRLAYDRGRRL